MSKYLKPKVPNLRELAQAQPAPVVTPVGVVPIEEDEEDIIKKKRKKKPAQQEPILTETPAGEGGNTGQLLN